MAPINATRVSRRAFLGVLGTVAIAAALPPAVAAPEFMGGTFASRLTDRQTGISIRFVKDYDIRADANPTRMDWFMAMPPVAR